MNLNSSAGQDAAKAFVAIPKMTEVQFLRWQNLLEERTGMCMPAQRQSFLQTSLSIRMREIGCYDFDEYLELVSRGARGAIEWSVLVDRLTVQETRFFRDPCALKFVRTYMEKYCQISSTLNSFNIWSVGCSSGEEVYTLAMQAEEVLNKSGFEYSVTGTDISPVVLKKAREGRYNERKVATLPDNLRQSYFHTVAQGKLQVTDFIRQRTCFTQVNVVELDQIPLKNLNIIYCQNVLIYFRRWRRKEILNALVERLAPGGLLITGLGEMVEWQHPDMIAVNDSTIAAYIKRGSKQLNSGGANQ